VFVAKPITSRDVIDAVLSHLFHYLARTDRRLWVFDPDGARGERVRSILAGIGAEITPVSDAAVASRALKDRAADCLIVPPGEARLVDELLATASSSVESVFTKLPVIVYGDGDRPSAEDDGWRRAVDLCAVRKVHSPTQLVEAATAFLHTPSNRLSEDHRKTLFDLYRSNQSLAGKTVLIVDDDVRNIFALSAVLEEYEINVSSADNGRDAIRLLRNNPRIDLVLMDIMMPELDGIETMREIRKVPELQSLPIVAVTAKAMKGDREKCIEAGAWDYLSKPVNIDHMLGVLRSWLLR
jgi:CheY-like chemotaxis protein